MKLLKLLLFFSCSIPAWSAGEVLGQARLIDYSPKANVVISAVSGTGPITVTTSGAHSLSGGWVYVYKPVALATLDTAAYKWGNWGRGYFGITILNATQFRIDSEMYTGATTGIGNGIAIGDKVVPLVTYYVRQGPKIWRDGPINKGDYDAGINYRAFESVTSGGNLYMSIADNNLGNTPPNTNWWKQLDATKVGPGTFTAKLRDNSSNGRATSANYEYTQLGAKITANCPAGVGWDMWLASGTGNCSGVTALKWFVDGDVSAGVKARKLLTQIEDMPLGGLACDTTLAYCGRTSGDFDVNRLDAWNYLPALEMIYDTIQGSDKTTLINKLLNDNGPSRNGVDSTDCTPVAYVAGAASAADTISARSYIVTGTGFLSKPGLGPGSVIYAKPFTGWDIAAMGRVKTVDSDTQMTMEICSNNACRVNTKDSNSNPLFQYWGFYTANEPGTSTPGANAPWWYSKVWDNGDHPCGLKWYLSHHPSSPRMMPGQEAHYPTTDYTPISGSNIDGTPESNRTYTSLYTWIAIGLMTANDDIRGVRLLEQATNYWMTQSLAQDMKSRWGSDGHGTQYGPGRVNRSIVGTINALANSLTVAPPGALTGVAMVNTLRWYQHSFWIGLPIFQQPYDTTYGINRNQDMLFGQAVGYLSPITLNLALLFPSETYSAYSWDYMRNRRGDYGNAQGNSSWSSIAYVPFLYMAFDPAFNGAPVSNTQLQLGVTETDADECLAAQLYCVVDANRDIALSTTGWTNTDTQVQVTGNSSRSQIGEDGKGTAGNITILQNNGNYSAYLLGGNGLAVSGYGNGQDPFGGMGGGGSQLVIHNGGTESSALNNLVSVNTAGAIAQYARLDRWAGPTRTGVDDNSYVYTRVNLTPDVRDPSTGYSTTNKKSIFTAAAGATNVTREVFHVKNGPNQQSYVVAYDHGAMNVANQLRAYWHLQSTPNKVLKLDMIGRHPEYVTFTPSSKTASITVPNTGRLNFKALAVAGSTNPTIALTASNYALPSTPGAITGLTWAGGTVTLTTAVQGYGGYALPSDGSVNITVSGAVPSAYNGTFPLTGYTNAGGVRTLTYALVSDPGAATTFGSVTFPPWCTYTNAYNFVASCNGAFPVVTSQFESMWPATYRIHSCGSTDGVTCDKFTDAEMLAVLQPSSSGSVTMPTITQPVCSGVGADCTAVQIEDPTYPAVVMIARKGQLTTAQSITSTHVGTAKYIVSGLSAGVYDVTRNGNPVKAGLVVGTGDTSITFASTAGDILVSNSGAPVGVLNVSPTLLAFTCKSDGTASSPQIVTISATGVTLDNWSATKTKAWLSLAPTTGSSNGSTTATLNCAGVPAGSDSDTITVSSTTANISNSPRAVGVSLTRYTPPSITSTSPLPSGTVGAAYSAPLSGTGGLLPYSWTLLSGAMCNGLTLNSNGSITGTPTTAETCNFTLRMTDSQPITADRAFSITISTSTPTITMALSPSSLSFSCAAGSSSSTPQTVGFTSSGGNLDQWQLSGVPVWATSIPSTGTIAADIDVSVNCTDLAAGSYSATLSVSSSTAGVTNSPRTVGVSVTVTALATIPVTAFKVGSTSAILRYVIEDGNAPCSVSDGPVNVLDAGGIRIRTVVLTGLIAGVTQTASVSCGSAVGSVTFTTRPTIGGDTTIKIERTAPEYIAVDQMRVDYGTTDGLGSSMTVNCTGHCVADLPTKIYEGVYFKTTYRKTGSDVGIPSRIEYAIATQ